MAENDPKPKELESAKPAARGETTRSAIHKLNESLKTGFGSLEQRLGTGQKTGAAPATPVFFPQPTKSESTRSPAAAAGITGPAAPSLPQPAAAGTPSFGNSTAVGRPAAAPPAAAFPSPRRLENRTATAAARAPAETPRSLSWPSATAIQPAPMPGMNSASGSAPMPAFSGQAAAGLAPRPFEAGRAVPFQGAPQAAGVGAVAGMSTTTNVSNTTIQPEGGTVTRSSGFAGGSVTGVGEITSLPKPGFKSGEGASLTPGAVPSGTSNAPGPTAYSPKSIDSAAMGRFAKTRADALGTRDFSKAAPGGLEPMKSPRAGAGGLTAQAGPSTGAPGSFDAQPGAAPATGGMESVTAKPGAMDTVRDMRQTSVQSVTAMPDLTAARSAAKQSAGASGGMDIKKAPWGNDKTGRDIVDKLTELVKVVKSQGN